jgi:hypothetical protein
LGSEIGPSVGAGSLVVELERAASGAAVLEEAAAVNEAAGSEVVELAAAELEEADRSAVSS